MRIAVYNLAAHEGGALVVLNQFFSDVIANQDHHEWLFLTQMPLQSTRQNVRVHRFDCSSILNRIFADCYGVPQILKEYKPDVVISLQNSTILGFDGPQYVYMHQSLQYCPYRFSLTKKEERGIAFRQRFICGSYRNGLKKAKHIFVQTKWIQEATAKWIGRPVEDITVVPVTLSEGPADQWSPSDESLFFYPARAEMYKNHNILIDACRKLGLSGYKVMLTVDVNETEYGKQLKKASEGLPIEFVGTLSREQVFKAYSKSVLVFPSYLETCGLPLVEAAQVGCPIIAADLPYAHEALNDYSNVQYFKFDDSGALAEKMKSINRRSGTMNLKKTGTNLVEAMLECINS